MEEFKKEVAEMFTTDIMLILEDQLDLYSDKEIEVLREELSKRSRSDEDLKNEKELINEKIKIKSEQKWIEEDKLKEQRLIEENKRKSKIQREIFETKINNLRSQGYDEYYEYTALTICDDSNGYVNINNMLSQMNELALKGWKLVTAFSNELGKNTSSYGMGGFSSGTNSTIEQNILIFERKVKIKSLNNE